MIRVLIADDQHLMRRALEHFLAQAEDIDVIGGADDGVQAVELARELRPDVVLMDMQMPRMDGVEATAAITSELDDVRVLAITTFTSEEYLIPALQAGASGYLLKDASPDEVTEGVRRVHRGDAVFSASVAHDLIAAATASPARSRTAEELPAHEKLTERELQVVQELAEGRSNAEIAEALFLAEATVKGHLGKIMDKWQVRDRVQLLLKAAQTGLVTL
ncbi:MAG: response regulator transcription factor [Micrococcus sp.]|nr:response regulator transcription factor [Micrococcus sp.]